MNTKYNFAIGNIIKILSFTPHTYNECIYCPNGAKYDFRFDINCMK